MISIRAASSASAWSRGALPGFCFFSWPSGSSNSGTTSKCGAGTPFAAARGVEQVEGEDPDFGSRTELAPLGLEPLRDHKRKRSALDSCACAPRLSLEGMAWLN